MNRTLPTPTLARDGGVPPVPAPSTSSVEPLSPVRPLSSVRPLSRAARHTAARFAINPADPAGPPAAHLARLAESLDRTLGPGAIALVTGPSGSGKSRLLRALRRALRASGRPCIEPDAAFPRAARVVDLMLRPPLSAGSSAGSTAQPLDHALALLAQAGLADARLMIARADRLSAGERTRLALARALAEANAPCEQAPGRTEPCDEGSSPQTPRLTRLCDEGSGTTTRDPQPHPQPPLSPSSPRSSTDPSPRLKAGPPVSSSPRLSVSSSLPPPIPTLLLDEFASVLDRPAAIALARAVHRWARRSAVRVIAATAHDDILEPLAPDALVIFNPDGSAEILARPPLPSI